MNLSLFIVVLGGRSSKSNIELHDVRWVIGESIQDTFPELRRQWLGQKQGLHIDSYKIINYIDGYKIVIAEAENTTPENIALEDKLLWFINLGGYNSESMNEEHEFTLVVANKAKEAKRRAKQSWKSSLKNKHNDDCSGINYINQIDNMHLINKINNWEIKLTPDPQNRSEKLIPDWYGYMRIDK